MTFMRWMLSEDGGTTYTREVKPVGSCTFTYERDLASGQIFFRHKLTTALRFIHKEDWDYFYALERRASKRCFELFIRREWKCGVNWRTYWTGTFSVGSGKFDLDRCIFEVKPEVNDRYTCLLRQQNLKVNLLLVPPVTANAVISPSIEWGGCQSTPVIGVGPWCYNVELNSSLEPINGWAQAYAYTFPDFTGTVFVYWRERLTTLCVGGLPTPPPGSGWTLLEDNCATDGTATYVRPPTISYGSGNPVRGTCVDGEPFPPNGDCDWKLIVDCQDGGTAGIIGPWYICYSPTPVVYSRARVLLDCLQFIIGKTGCPLGQLRSDFLEWNSPGTAAGYSPGINYVTGAANQVDHLLLIQKSDAIDPTATNPAVIGEMTFKEMMTMLSSMRLYWDIDAQGNLRIEHWKHWTFRKGWT